MLPMASTPSNARGNCILYLVSKQVLKQKAYRTITLCRLNNGLLQRVSFLWIHVECFSSHVRVLKIMRAAENDILSSSRDIKVIGDVSRIGRMIWYQFKSVRTARLELATFGTGIRCSTN